jgi:hypothetical protein
VTRVSLFVEPNFIFVERKRRYRVDRRTRLGVIGSARCGATYKRALETMGRDGVRTGGGVDRGYV